jgi:hypothetical protein
MKQIRYYLLALLTVMMLVGCTEDNSMSEFKYPTEEQEGSVDEVLKALKAVPGICNVQLAPEGIDIDEKNDDKKASSDEKNEAKCYSFYFEQPVDHHNPQLGTYFQQCWLKFKGVDKNVVVLTHGYALSNYLTDMAKQLDANELHIEHRYFGESLPEPFDNLKMTYLHADQQASDIHNVVSALKQHLFKTGKWACTGTSKDGITTALQAYYSEQNGWKDFDVYVPFCAPFMVGTTYNDGSYSCSDITAVTYLRDVCGSGYPAGSKEAVAGERLRKIPLLICTNEYIRRAAIKAFYEATPEDYVKVVEQYNNKSAMSTGNQTKDLAAFAINSYYNALFGKYSYIPFRVWAQYVPDLTRLENNTATQEEWDFFKSFITWDDKKLFEFLRNRPAVKKEEGTTRADNDDNDDNIDLTEEQWAFLLFRRAEPSAPYKIQAFMELGHSENDYGIVNGTGYLTEEECERVNDLFTNQYAYSQAGAAGIYKQDGGKLMTDFRNWVETERTQPIIFVYAYNDPWTGSGISDAAAQVNPMIVKVVDAIATHDDSFLHRDFYTTESKDLIVNALNKFLK